MSDRTDLHERIVKAIGNTRRARVRAAQSRDTAAADRAYATAAMGVLGFPQQSRGAVDLSEVPLRRAERAIVRGLRDAGLGDQSQVTHADRFEIATDDLIVRVTLNTGAVDPSATYQCPMCSGTGSIESSDSTDDRWWDCSRCKGTGKVADRRRQPPAGPYRLTPELAAVAATLVDLMKHGLPPHISESQQAEKGAMTARVAAEDALYLCRACEQPSSVETWQAAWWRERSRRSTAPEWNDDDYGSDYGLDGRMVCPRCGRIHLEDLNARDDETEARLLDRLERGGLLKDGMTATIAREVLDA